MNYTSTYRSLDGGETEGLPLRVLHCSIPLVSDAKFQINYTIHVCMTLEVFGVFLGVESEGFEVLTHTWVTYV
jgi:hypothetical protein